MDFEPRQVEKNRLDEVCGACEQQVAQCICATSGLERTKEEDFGGSMELGAEIKSARAILAPGSYIQGKYKIESMIGEGGMGQVFKGVHEALDKSFAIKVLRSEVVANDKAIRRFDQEAKATSQLSHQNLCQIFDYGLTDGGMPYLVMDLLDGKDLRDVIAEQGPLEPGRVIDLFLAVTDGIDHAHSMGVVHRDLKPSNIIVITTATKGEAVKVVDFGIAKVMPPPGTESNQLTQTGEIFGSPLYMSPEQCQGLKVDGRSDIYSLGCVMYECLTGKPPFEGANPVQTILKHVNEELKPFDAGLEIPQGLQTIVTRALAKDPDERYQTVRELHADLQRLRAGEAPSQSARRDSAPMQYLRSRKKMLLLAASIFMLSTVVIVGSAFVQYFQTLSRLSQGANTFASDEPWRLTFEQGKSDQANRNDQYAEEKFRRALEQATTSSNPELARLQILQRLGDLYIECAEKGEDSYPEARKCFAEAVSLALKSGTLFDRAHTLERLAEVEYKLKDYSDAEKHFQQALEFREKEPSPIPMSSTLMKQGNNFKRLKKWEAAHQAYVRAAEYLAKVPGQELFIGNAYKGIAQTNNMMGRYSESDGAFKQAEEYLTKANSIAARADLQLAVKEHIEMLVRSGRTQEAEALKAKLKLH